MTHTPHAHLAARAIGQPRAAAAIEAIVKAWREAVKKDTRHDHT